MMRLWPTLLILICLTLPASGRADVADSQKQLNQIKARIEKAEKELDRNRQSELKFSRELALLKKTLQRIDGRIDRLAGEQRRLQTQIGEQQKLISRNRNETKQLTQRLKKRLIALYKEGEVGPLKILFSADSPTEMVQQYHYLTQVLGHDRQLLEEYRAVFKIQKEQLDRLQRLEKEKSQLLTREKDERRAASDGRQLKSRLLARAQKNKQALSGELRQLKENSARLKELIARLKRDRSTRPGPLADHFSAGKGKLRWPLDGEVLIGFGTQKDSKLGTYYESNGIEIAARPGTPIQAVAAGQVVFADYFKGYGNLYIVSHPGGYHTLYAQTDRMQKKTGDTVSAGALLGYSGLDGRDSIYFEIRSNGSPVNPLKWLIRR